MEKSFLYLAFAIILGVVGQFFYKTGALKQKSENLFSIVFNPYFILASSFYALSSIFWFLSLRKLELSFAYPFLAIGYVLVFLIGITFFKESIKISKIIGIILIAIGLIILSLRI